MVTPREDFQERGQLAAAADLTEDDRRAPAPARTDDERGRAEQPPHPRLDALHVLDVTKSELVGGVPIDDNEPESPSNTDKSALAYWKVPAIGMPASESVLIGPAWPSPGRDAASAGPYRRPCGSS